MDKHKFLKLIGFPEEFAFFDSYPEELFQQQYLHFLQSDEPLGEDGLIAGSEHYRGGFYWHCHRTGVSRETLFEIVSKEPDLRARAWLLKEMGF
jgi:hypothetical protein